MKLLIGQESPVNLLDSGFSKKRGAALLLTVTDYDYFLKTVVQSDWTPPEVFDELARMGYDGGEMMEGLIEFYEEYDEDKMRADLEQSNLFVYDQAFADFMNQFMGP